MLLSIDRDGSLGSIDLSAEQAEALAIALVQATPTGDEVRIGDFEVSVCEPPTCLNVVLAPLAADPMASRDDPFILERTDAVRLGLALIRAAGRAKEDEETP